jgi:hypothetical protein
MNLVCEIEHKTYENERTFLDYMYFVLIFEHSIQALPQK